MKNWARKFNPHKTAYRTPALFKTRKINKIEKIKIKKIKKGN